jgi:radical SAM superfamily enzyme YgiQ (UPF0313 family)
MCVGLEVKMKVLLVAVNAKYIHSNLAIYSLRSYAAKYADQISLLELTINHSEEDILKEIYKEKADIVAFSCYIWNIGIIKRVSSELKKVSPGVKLWFGGPEVSYDAKQCLTKEKELDGIIIGEGEQTFLELMEYYVEGNRELSDIVGLAYKESARIEFRMQKEETEDPEVNRDRIIVTSERTPISLDSIPFPYQDMDDFRNKIIYYESSRGCPFSCSYCLSSIDKRVRLRSTEFVKKELKFLMDQQVPQVKFVDRTFNCDRRHAMEIWRFVKENDNGITNFHFEISADLLNEEEIGFLSTLRPGQIQFEIGVQSTNPDTVGAIHRKTDFHKLSYNVLKIREGRNIHQHLDLIAGLPLEGYASFEKSFKDVYHLKPDQLQLGFLKILKGSSMETDSSHYGITYRSTPPYEVLFTDHLTYDEVLKIKGACEMVEVYYNSAQFTYSIDFLGHFYDSPMKLYQSISDFYENRGFALLAHSRIKRYEILLDFYKEVVLESIVAEDKQDMETLFEEILVLDLYLREAMKTRPNFAPLSLPPNKLREIYEIYGADRKSIHVEHFTFDVISSAKEGRAVKKPTMIIFDYASRDPLNKAAKLVFM